jgi:hypothetical protein
MKLAARLRVLANDLEASEKLLQEHNEEGLDQIDSDIEDLETEIGQAIADAQSNENDYDGGDE